MAKLNELQAINDKLGCKVSCLSNNLRDESSARQKAEEKIRDLESHLSAAHTQESILSQENRHLSTRVRQLTKRIGHSDKEVKKIMSRLGRLNPVKTKLR